MPAPTGILHDHGMEMLTTRQLYAQGLTFRDIERLTASGDLIRHRRGCYSRGSASPEDVHLALARLHDQPWALETAALAHGLPLLSPIPSQVQLVEPGCGRSISRPGRFLHSAPLPAQDLCIVDGAPVTTLARTVVDITRLRGLSAGLVPWEAARWRAREEGTLLAFDALAREVVDRLRRRKGIARARSGLEVASCLSQSPMETLSLHMIRGLGLPLPEQQFAVHDDGGSLIGIADFAWPDVGVLGEYDGKDKYDRLALPGESPRDVVRREKRRQERMELMGWVFARWGREELATGHLLARRLQRAFGIARQMRRLSAPAN